jgi:serine/threonine-protein kinase RsbW
LSNQEISLTVPSMPEFLRVARVTASGLASRLGFSIDEVDDLRLALDELCFALIGKGDPDGELALTYVLNDRRLSIEGKFERAGTAEPLALGELSRQILTALVDTHQIWDGDGAGHFSLEKQSVR